MSKCGTIKRSNLALTQRHMQKQTSRPTNNHEITLAHWFALQSGFTCYQLLNSLGRSVCKTIYIVLHRARSQASCSPTRPQSTTTVSKITSNVVNNLFVFAVNASLRYGDAFTASLKTRRRCIYSKHKKVVDNIAADFADFGFWLRPRWVNMTIAT